MARLETRMTVRISEEHLQALRRAEETTGLTRPEIVRRAILGIRMPSIAKKRQIAEIDQLRADLGRIGGLLVKSLRNRDLPPAEARQALWELRRLLPIMKAAMTKMLENP